MFSYSTDPAYNDLFSPLGIFAKSRISEEFLVENFGPPSTFKEIYIMDSSLAEHFSGNVCFTKEKVIVCTRFLKGEKLFECSIF